MADIMVKRIDKVTVTTHISENEIRARLMKEFLGQTDMVGPDGRPQQGVNTSIRRGKGTQGGYTLTAERDNEAVRQIEHKRGEKS